MNAPFVFYMPAVAVAFVLGYWIGQDSQPVHVVEVYPGTIVQACVPPENNVVVLITSVPKGVKCEAELLTPLRELSGLDLEVKQP